MGDIDKDKAIRAGLRSAGGFFARRGRKRIIAIVFSYYIYLYFKNASYTLKPGDSIVLKVPTSKQKEFTPKLYLSRISGGKLELSGKTSWWQVGEGNLVGTNYDVLKQEISEIYSSSSNIPTKIIKNDPNNSIYLSKEGHQWGHAVLAVPHLLQPHLGVEPHFCWNVSPPESSCG